MREWGAAGRRKRAPWRRIVFNDRAAISQGAYYGIYRPTTARQIAASQLVHPLLIAPRSLSAASARVAYPRRAASVADPLAAVLSLTVAAILANQLSELAIAQWGGATAGRAAARPGHPASPR